MIAARSHFKSSFVREFAAYGSVSGATAGSRGVQEQVGGAEDMGLLQMEDWTAMTWHLKGYSLVVISLCLRCDHPLKGGANARRLAEVA
eukprot:3618152-Pyramimonas_sp.AAC.1